MYHITNLGSFANHVRVYADMNGYVPESVGDLYRMDYDDPNGDLADTDYAREFVSLAIAATEASVSELAEWQSKTLF